MVNEKDKNGMIPLPNHMDFERLFRPRRPTEEGFIGGNYAQWAIVSFSASWCGPCQRLNKKLIVDATPEVTWYAVDVDENKTSLGYAGCDGIPAFVIIKDGVFVDRKVGASSVADVLNWLNKHNVPLNV